MHTTDSTLQTLYAPSGIPTAPRVYLSSAEAGWKGLAAQAFHEPREMPSWVVPAQAYLSLILFAGR